MRTPHAALADGPAIKDRDRVVPPAERGVNLAKPLNSTKRSGLHEFVEPFQRHLKSVDPRCEAGTQTPSAPGS
jgi:hypothetical protein